MSATDQSSPRPRGPARRFIPMPQRHDAKADSAIYLNGRQLGTIADFWAWAFTDLRDNTFRGIFAEWLVGMLLGLSMDRRGGWDCYDLRSSEKTIEVKCSSYLQPWAQHALTKPVYGRLFSRCWDPRTDTFGPAAFNADVYVFCLQACKVAARWDALDLSQWRFWALPRQALVDNKARTLSQAGLVRLAAHAFAFPQPMTAETLAVRLRPELGLAEQASADIDLI